MKVYKLTSGRGRKISAQYFANEADAIRCYESYRKQGVKRLNLQQIDVEQNNDTKRPITEEYVLPNLLGRIVNYNDLGHVIKAVVTRVCTTYPNIGMTVKPLEPSRHHFGDPFEQISFGVRAPFEPSATLI